MAPHTLDDCAGDVPDLFHIVKELAVVAEETTVHKIVALDAGKSQGKFVAVGLVQEWGHSKHIFLKNKNVYQAYTEITHMYG